MTVPYVFVNYLKHLIAPFHLSLIYGTSFITSAADPRFLLPVGILLGLGYYFLDLPKEVVPASVDGNRDDWSRHSCRYSI